MRVSRSKDVTVLYSPLAKLKRPSFMNRIAVDDIETDLVTDQKKRHPCNALD